MPEAVDFSSLDELLYLGTYRFKHTSDKYFILW
jgi:hypothetical protein